MDINIKRSRILDHSRNNKTDSLYQPLRKAISEASIPKTLKQTNIMKQQKNLIQQSKVSKKFLQLTSSKAKDMAENILIPTDEEIVPTKDIYKIQNIKFVAISVNTKQNLAINQQQFQDRRKLGTQITVYQINKIKEQQKNTVLQTPFKNRASQIKQKIQQMTLDRSRQRGRSLVSFENPRASILFRNSLKKSQNQLNTVVNEYGLNDNNKNIVANYSSVAQNHNFTQQRNDLNQSKPIQNNLMQSRASSMSSRRSSRFLRVFSKDQQVILSDKKLQNLDKFNMVAQFNPQMNVRNSAQMKSRDSTQNYKYNAFSAIDLPVNTRCAHCGSNQIIASKPTNPWN